MMPPLATNGAFRPTSPWRPASIRNAITLAAILSVCIAAFSAQAFNFAATGSGPAPDVTFLDRDGNERSLAEFQGRVVVLNLWATWCAPCRKEMPSLDRLQAELGGDDFEVIALAVDRGDVAKIAGFYDEVGVGNLALYHDPTAKAGRALKAPGLPTTLIIDRQGDEIGRVLGDAEWDGEDALELIRAAIAD